MSNTAANRVGKFILSLRGKREVENFDCRRGTFLTLASTNNSLSHWRANSRFLCLLCQVALLMTNKYTCDLQRAVVQINFQETKMSRMLPAQTSVSEFLVEHLERFGIDSGKFANHFHACLLPQNWQNQALMHQFYSLGGEKNLLDCIIRPSFVGTVTRENWQEACVLYSTHKLLFELKPDMVFLQEWDCELQHVQMEQVTQWN